MAGEYRTEAVLAKLPKGLSIAIRAGLRIALTNQAMTGVAVRTDLINEMAAAFEVAGESKYANGLRSGAMVPVSPTTERYWAPGELFFMS